MSDQHALSIIILVTGVAGYVFTWQHNAWLMAGAIAVSTIAALLKD